MSPPRRYVPAEDVGVVCAYFAPRPSAARVERFRRFAAPFRAGGATLRVAELVLGDRAPELPDGDDVVRLRGRDALWHKERLLERAIRALPASCTKIVWVDADVVFRDADWLQQTSAVLEHASVAQPFSRAIQATRDAAAEAPSVASYAHVFAEKPEARRTGRFEAHGHTGYAWAARRALVEAHGLFTACIAGGADHAMAHAFTGDLEGACLDRVLGRGPLRASFTEWATAVRTATRGHVGSVAGDLEHMWHGDLAERRYVERYEMLHGLGFDPARDLVDADDTWELAPSADPRLRAWLADYFARRTND